MGSRRQRDGRAARKSEVKDKETMVGEVLGKSPDFKRVNVTGEVRVSSKSEVHRGGASPSSGRIFGNGSTDGREASGSEAAYSAV